MVFITRILENLVSFRRIPLKVIMITAFASYILQLGAIIQGQPLYIIVLFTALPWIPVLLFEGLWKIEQYNIMAIFGIIVILQLGHLGEHVTQVSQLSFLSGTLACPPPVDNFQNANLAVEAGLRSADDTPTGISSSNVVMQDPATGLPTQDANGEQITGPASCGVLGQLDIEIVHLIWDSLGWLATLWLLTKYPRNVWLWISMIVSSWHTVEHFFISWIFFVDNDLIFNGVKQLWATTVDGRIVTAIPVGLQEQLVSFYDAGGKSGLAGKGGMFDALFGIGEILPTRAFLHFGYNLLITLPLVPAFLIEVRREYDSYLAEALPELTDAQIASVTPQLEPIHFDPGEAIVRQHEPADRFYVITKGEAEVIRTQPDGEDLAIARLQSGQYFGEIGLLQGGRRMATVRAVSNVEVLALGRDAFIGLLGESEMSEQEVERVMEQRVAEVEAKQSQAA